VFVELPEPWMQQPADPRHLKPLHAAVAFMDIMTLWLLVRLANGNNMKLDIKQDGSAFGVRREDEELLAETSRAEEHP